MGLLHVSVLHSASQSHVHVQFALRCRPRFADACSNMAAVYAQLGDVPKAIEYFSAALRMDPSLVDALQHLGDLLLSQGAASVAQAKQCFEAALQQNVGAARAWRGLGDALRESGDHAGAITFYAQVRWQCLCVPFTWQANGDMCVCHRVHC